MIKTLITKKFRGDKIEIPIEYEFISGATYRAHLRRTAESTEYITLQIQSNSMAISVVQSENLIQGSYLAELEENNQGIISTVQRSTVVIKNDVTRNYGEPVQDWETNQSVEVAEIIAKDIYIRNEDNSISKIQADVHFRHIQNLPSDTWLITHNLGKRPSVVITDSAGTVVEGQITYIDVNNILIEFSAGFSGFAELN